MASVLDTRPGATEVEPQREPGLWRRLAKAAGMPVAQVALVAALIGLWFTGTSAGWFDTFIVGTPGDTAAELRQLVDSGFIFQSAWATVKVMLIGWAIGMASGILFGTLLGLSEFAKRVADPFLSFFNGMPRLVLYPFLVIWLGFELKSKIVLVVVVIFVQVVTIIASGFREVDPNVVSNVRLMGGGAAALARDVYGPAMALWIVGSARVTVGHAFQAAIAAEFVGATIGVGYLAVIGQNNFNVNTIWAALLAVVVIAWVIDSLISLGERYTTRWQPA